MNIIEFENEEVQFWMVNPGTVIMFEGVLLMSMRTGAGTKTNAVSLKDGSAYSLSDTDCVIPFPNATLHLK